MSFGWTSFYVRNCIFGRDDALNERVFVGWRFPVYKLFFSSVIDCSGLG
jgi:hypothetical protein